VPHQAGGHVGQKLADLLGFFGLGVIGHEALDLAVGVHDDALVALVGGGQEERVADLPVLGLGDARARVDDLGLIGAVVVHELAVLPNGFGELVLFEVDVGEP
jgi:hypothetical protein